MKKLIAVCSYHTHEEYEIEVTKISVWIGLKNEHEPDNIEAIKALVNEAMKSRKMQIYSGGQFHGDIDAYDGTPLYTNGQVNVERLVYDGKVIWKYHKTYRQFEYDLCEWHDKNHPQSSKPRPGVISILYDQYVAGIISPI